MSTTKKVFPANMNLRDYFAAKAMQGLVANPEGIYDLEKAVRWAYIVADEMLKARKEP